VIAAIYARVSTEKQDYTGQIAELRDYARRNEWTVTEYFEKESAMVGSNRPVHKQLMADAAAKKFDVILVWKVDRFGRSLVEFIHNVLLLDGYGIRFVACAGGIDTDKRNPFAKMLMHLLAMFAEFEIDLIHELTGAGQKRYRELYARGAVGKDKPRQSRTGKNLPVGRPMKIIRPRPRRRDAGPGHELGQDRARTGSQCRDSPAGGKESAGDRMKEFTALYMTR
jgi:putative DNA-invertase from lambdoid prophage Rac